MLESTRRSLRRILLTQAAAFAVLALLGGAPALADHHEANPCAAKEANPCAEKAKANPCNPCAAKANPCNPCAAKANPCNPCAAKKNPCAGQSK
jgi:hypothetical protein